MTVWTTQDGRSIAVTEMTDSHLTNTIIYLRRRNRKALFFLGMREALSIGSYIKNAPDGAAMAAEEAVDEIVNRKCDDLFLAQRLPIFSAMLTEAEKRGLSV